MSELNDRAFGWDDEIENDGSEFVILPAGDYNFVVKEFERARHAGSEKLPPCDKAILHIEVRSSDGEKTTLKHNLFLHSRTEGLLCSFFSSIGQRKKGERIKPNWSTVVGSTGRLKLGVRNWKSDKGEDMQSNEIKKFYEYEEKLMQGFTEFDAGDFKW